MELESINNRLFFKNLKKSKKRAKKEQNNNILLYSVKIKNKNIKQKKYF
jgi:hypothetical protein